jgi:phosphoribosylformylglycinamidine synthase subunit PurQ / glutaminase
VTPTVGVISFPGSNGDDDAVQAFSRDLGVSTRLVDYRETDLSPYQALVLPGGFSYGDHLRPGAIARFAPAMKSVRDFAERGGPVLGICNGFQVLTEAHLLPGALLRNASLRFHCQRICVRVEHTNTPWTRCLELNSVLSLPIAHGDGAYFADDETLDRLEAAGQVVFRYCEIDGSTTTRSNPNGSSRFIAGICSEGRNVVGLMPHPERATDPLLGRADGRLILESVFHSMSLGV